MWSSPNNPYDNNYFETVLVTPLGDFKVYWFEHRTPTVYFTDDPTGSLEIRIEHKSLEEAKLNIEQGLINLTRQLQYLIEDFEYVDGN